MIIYRNEHHDRVHGTAGVGEYIRRLEERIDNLTEIGKALSKEKDNDRLLERILVEARRIADASLQARIMTIADIFEALTAGDRPYKKGTSPARAVKILEKMKNDGHIDPDLFDVFINENVYEAYASRSAMAARHPALLRLSRNPPA